MEKQPAETSPGPVSMSGTTVPSEQKDLKFEDNALVNPAVVNEDGDEVEDAVQYVTGVRLAVIIVAVIIIAMLIMLDMSIIATVSSFSWKAHPAMRTYLSHRRPLGLRATSTRLRMWVGTEVLIC